MEIKVTEAQPVSPSKPSTIRLGPATPEEINVFGIASKLTAPYTKANEGFGTNDQITVEAVKILIGSNYISRSQFAEISANHVFTSSRAAPKSIFIQVRCASDTRCTIRSTPIGNILNARIRVRQPRSSSIQICDIATDASASNLNLARKLSKAYSVTACRVPDAICNMQSITSTRSSHLDGLSCINQKKLNHASLNR